MEQNETGYEPYFKSFNTAYTIYKNMPEVAKQIAKSLPGESLWNDGFRDGVEQAEIDAEMELPKYLRKNRLESFKENKNQIRNQNKSKDDFDKD